MREASFVILPDSEALALEAARRVVALAQCFVASQGYFSMALSGGSTPSLLYQHLAGEPYLSLIPWKQVYTFWADERCVPPDDPASNYRLVYELLIRHVPIPPANIHRMQGELEPSMAAQVYHRELREFFCDGQTRFDLILLGLGKDGHTASLFPNSEALHETHRLAVATTADYEDRPSERVTLTLSALNRARQILFLVNGGAKAEAVGTVLADTGEHLPARRIHPAAGKLTWLLDMAAARLVNLSQIWQPTHETPPRIR